MKLFKAAILLSLFVSQAFAQENVQTAPKRQRIYSRDVRATSDMSVLVMPIGNGLFQRGGGITLSFFLATDHILELDLLKGELGYRVYRTELRSNGLNLHYKFFATNTFYVKSGIDYRTIESKRSDDDDWYSSDPYSYTFKGNSTSATVALGNQWQIGNFTLGADWVGLAIPFASRLTSEESSILTIQQRRDMEDEKNRTLNQDYLYVTRLYLGASF